MGTWGHGIFDDDMACDIADDYLPLLAYGVPENEAFMLLRDRYKLWADDDSPFCLPVAAIQQKYGILMPEIKETALRILENGTDFFLQESTSNTDSYKKRKKVLDDLKKKLLAPPLPKRKVPKDTSHKPRWKLGDVVISKIVCKYYKDEWFYNKYVLYRVVRIDSVNISYLRPDLGKKEWVYGALYDWIGDEIPETSILKNLKYHKEYNQMKKRSGIHLLTMHWIPRHEKFTLFQRDCEYPLPTEDEIIVTNSHPNILGYLPENHYDPNGDFFSKYEKECFIYKQWEICRKK